MTISQISTIHPFFQLNATSPPQRAPRTTKKYHRKPRSLLTHLRQPPRISQVLEKLAQRSKFTIENEMTRGALTESEGENDFGEEDEFQTQDEREDKSKDMKMEMMKMKMMKLKMKMKIKKMSQ